MYLQQSENLQKVMLCNQNGIVGAQPVIAALADTIQEVEADYLEVVLNPRQRSDDAIFAKQLTISSEIVLKPKSNWYSI